MKKDTSESDESENTICQWVCPFCDEKGRGIASDWGSAKNELLSHIRSTENEKHGPKHRLPEGITEDDLSAVIERVDGYFE